MVTDQGTTGEKEEEEEEEGWTSADQTNDAETGRVEQQEEESEHEDEGLVFGKRDVKGKKADVSMAKPPPMSRTDTNTTLSEARPERTPVATALEHDAPSLLTDPTKDQQLGAPPGPAPLPVRRWSEETLAVQSGEEGVRTMPHSPEQQRDVRGSGPIRNASAASTRNVMGAGSRDVTASPASVRSTRKRTSLMPRESSINAAPPKLSTEYAFAGGVGQQRDGVRRNEKDTHAGMVTSPSEPARLHERSIDSASQYRFSAPDPSSRRKSSISSSRSSFINLPGVSPSLGLVTQEAANAESTGPQTSRALQAMQRASIGGGGSQSAFTLPRRERTKSWQSTGSTEAAKLANRLRMSRGGESVDEGTTTSSASRMLANSGTKYFMGIRSDGPTVKSLARYNKPTVSVFVNREDDFRSVEKSVTHGSLFDENFARARLGTEGSEDDQGEEDRRSSGGDIHVVRYLMDYGLSGPAIQKTPTTQALLSTCLDNDEFEATWAPALAQAAGLGDDHRGQGLAVEHGDTVTGLEGMALGGAGTGGGVYINGPNATPLHFLHGLTNTADSPFPLDETDMAREPDDATAGAQGEYVDAKNLRAVALTWAALNATKSHIVTRRYVDPMRESMERVTLAGDIQLGPQGGPGQGRPSHGTGGSYMSHPGGQIAGSGATTPGGTLRWGWRQLFSEQVGRE